MKDQSQEPMAAPTTYYPSWQPDATHHQGWTNQFMQHIPHTSSAAAVAGSMDFATPPQSYPYSTANGCVQNGIMFDPNYSRSYPAATSADYSSAAGAPPTNAASKTPDTEEGSVAANHNLPADPNNLSTNHQAPNYGTNPAAASNGIEWDWTNEKLYQQQQQQRMDKSKIAEEHALQPTDYNSTAYYTNHSEPPVHIKKESQSPTKTEAKTEKDENKSHSSSSSSHERNFLTNESQKYPPFNHQSYFNMYYPTTYSMEHTSSAPVPASSSPSAVPMSKYHSVLPPPASSSSYHHHHQTHYDHHQDTPANDVHGTSSPFKVEGKDKKVYHHDDGGGGNSATSANSLLANESGNDEEASKNNSNSNSNVAAASAATYDKSRKESKLYQPQLNLNNSNDRDSSGGGVAIGEGPTKDDHHHVNAPRNNMHSDDGESGGGKGESFAAKHHQQHHHHHQLESGRQLMSPSSMAIKEEPIDGYYQHNQHNHHQQQQQHQQHPQHHRDYQQSKLYQSQNGYYPYPSVGGGETNENHHHHRFYNPDQQQHPHPMSKDMEMEKRLNGGFDLNGDETTNPVICPTNFEKEIPTHTYHIPAGRLNGSSSSVDDMSHYGKLANGIKAEPIAQDYNSEGPVDNEQYFNGVMTAVEEKKVEPIETPIEKHPSPPETPVDRTEKAQKPEVPDCDCFSSEKTSPEPGSYYTHLGSATSLTELRTDFETRFNIRGRQLRIEKVLYTGKEGKTGQGCPLAKWIIRRTDQEEKVLCIVKKRQGHRCSATFLIICIVVWDGIPKHEADDVYKLLIHKLNKFGLPTTRRCATNENRTCACQGLDPETSGASYSFGCSWSMYYNGCKYARSKTVRKFRLSVKSEEAEIEERMNYLATMLAPLYERATPKAYENQCKYEHEAPDCRLGFHNGKPFSGVTACMDFCAHAHRDLHNMQDGCTVQVALLRNRHQSEEIDEQLHILPLYVMDTTDEVGSADAQKEKNNSGGVQTLEKFPCEVRIRSTPLQPCRRHGKKRPGKDGEEESPPASQAQTTTTTTTTSSSKKESSSKSSKSKSSSAAKNDSNSSNSKSPGASQSPRSQTPSTTSTGAAATAAATATVAGLNGEGNNTSAFVAPNQQQQQQFPGSGEGAPGGVAGATVAGGGENTSAGGGLLNPNSNLVNMESMIENFTDAQLQSNQISSTVLDSPYTYDYNTGSYVDSRHNYYNHPAAAVHPHHVAAAAQPPHQPAAPPPPATTHQHQPQWPDFNNNHHNNSSSSSGHTNPGAPSTVTAFDQTTARAPVNVLQLGLKHRGPGGIEENPDSTNHSLYNGFSSTSSSGALLPETAKVTSPEVDYFKPKNEYQHSHHHHHQTTTHLTGNQGSYSMYPPPPPPHHPHHHHHHHHPGFVEHQAYQQNYDYRYNYSPYANQPFHHHPYPGMYSPSAYSGAHGWNSMYSSAGTPAVNPAMSVSPHIPVSAATGCGPVSASPFGPTGGYGNQLMPLSSPVAPVSVIKAEPVPKVEPIGEVQEVNDNLEAFQDSQMGGIGIALGHGSVLFECAKHEMHATSALRLPNRTHPNRIALIFYQHRNLNRPKHGTEEWEEKMRLKKNNQEVENRLLKSIKQEGADENNGGGATTGSSSGGGAGSSKKSAKGSSKTDKNVTTVAATAVEVDVKPDMTTVLQSSQSSALLQQQIASPVLPVAPSWPANFSMGYPMSSPYHHQHHPHHLPHAHPHHHPHHHHMMGPIAKGPHIGSPTKT